jgi:hypothetical protein
MTSRRAEEAAATHGIESIGIDRFCLQRSDLNGLVLGFAAFGEAQIRRSIVELAAALAGTQIKS